MDMLFHRGLVMPVVGDKEVSIAAAALPKHQQGLIGTLADNAAITQRVERSNDNVIAELREFLDESSAYGPVAILFDRELKKAPHALKVEDQSKLD